MCERQGSRVATDLVPGVAVVVPGPGVGPRHPGLGGARHPHPPAAVHLHLQPIRDEYSDHVTGCRVPIGPHAPRRCGSRWRSCRHEPPRRRRRSRRIFLTYITSSSVTLLTVPTGGAVRVQVEGGDEEGVLQQLRPHHPALGQLVLCVGLKIYFLSS